MRSMVSPERLDQIAHRFAWLETRMAQGNLGAELAALGREYAELKPIMEQITTYRLCFRAIRRIRGRR